MKSSRSKCIFFVLAWITAGTWAFVTPIEVPAIDYTPPPQFMSPSSPFIGGISLILSMDDKMHELPSGLQKDQVVRVLDANTIKLKKNGVVTLAGVRMPNPSSAGKFQFPDCLSYTPAYKLRQLVPSKSDVLVKVGSTTSKGKLAQAIIVRSEDAVLVNQELVRTGFGKVQIISSVDLKQYLDMDKMRTLEARAKENGIGIFQRCDNQESSGFEAQFEPLELSMETEWSDDGGKLVMRQKDNESPTLQDPGDVKGCSDFSTYEDALRWYERYFPLYGDVSKLDRDGDGIPCPGLPHTKVSEKYRMKVPSAVKQ